MRSGVATPCQYPHPPHHGVAGIGCVMQRGRGGGTSPHHPPAEGARWCWCWCVDSPTQHCLGVSGVASPHNIPPYSFSFLLLYSSFGVTIFLSTPSRFSFFISLFGVTIFLSQLSVISSNLNVFRLGDWCVRLY